MQIPENLKQNRRKKSEESGGKRKGHQTLVESGKSTNKSKEHGERFDGDAMSLLEISGIWTHVVLL